MNTRDPSLQAVDFSRAFVAGGVLRFARAHLARPGEVFDHLAPQARLGELLDLPPDDWSAQCRALAAHAPAMPGALGRLLADLQLQLPEWFALALAGETEASHLLNLALAQLQAAHAQRPTLHLLAAMSQHLFGAELRPLAWPNHRLVRAGLLQLDRQGPLPAAALTMSPALWALLCGDTSAWPDTMPLPPSGAALPAALRERLAEVTTLMRAGAVRTVVLRGARGAGLAAAAQLAEALQRPALRMATEAWRREPALAPACRYAGWLPVLTLELGPGDREALGDQPLALPMVVVAGASGAVEAPALLELEIPPLTPAERLAAWQAALPAEARDAAADLAGHALLDGPTIAELAERITLQARSQGQPPGLAHLRQVRGGHGSERLRQLAQPVSREVEVGALVLPGPLQQQFDALLARCRTREWLCKGLGASLAEPAPGVRALFCGESGAGKTLAAHRLANALGGPLFRVDLSAVMNKYIGESEKNLGRLLDEAAALDAILLLDEADALFGRRGEGKDTGERYANMLTNFLLTRIERHPGIVLLTSNSRGRIDSAFTRRFDAILEFPLPGAEERLRLWQSHLGARSPGDALLQLMAGYCDLSGGHIRNAVLHAAAMDAAEASLPPDAPARALSAQRLVASLLEEYRKLGRTPPAQLLHARGAP
jgi:ATPase family associated with various cellular activities (AAA)